MYVLTIRKKQWFVESDRVLGYVSLVSHICTSIDVLSLPSKIVAELGRRELSVLMCFLHLLSLHWVFVMKQVPILECLDSERAENAYNAGLLVSAGGQLGIPGSISYLQMFRRSSSSSGGGSGGRNNIGFMGVGD